MAEPATEEKKMIPDWTKLPEELLQIITHKMNCFDVVHARSVSTLWRSAFPYPASLLRSSYSLPTYPVEKDGLCSLHKIPLVLVIDESACEFFMGLVGRDESADYMEEVPSPLQCSLRVKMRKSDPTILMNVIGSQIVSLGHQYTMVCWDPKGLRTTYKNAAAILPLGGGEFVVLRIFSGTLFVLTSAKRKWVQLRGVPSFRCTALVTFRGRFYASFFYDKEILAIHPYSLVAVRLIPQNFTCEITYLIPAGDDELFLVKKNKPYNGPVTCTVSRLEGLGWAEVDDIGDRVLFLGEDHANVCFSANQLPDGCGMTGNSILFSAPPGDETYFCKYGPPEVPKENVVGEWRSSRESRVKFIDSHEAYAFRVEF
ncbi:unnamed protein product [Brassica rapa]|uniref:F-box domain-containing protein n=3 Tax=Brassica TaxID=3705 RepID=A0A3P5Z6A9_BRACM|nr:unnamed protein product [Brassica napus]CAG7872624.1 unnamed protein product [Brassica rapa]VDC68471.1 unnamed protein product [Brassica rapa]